MCATFLVSGQVMATPSAQVAPSADWMLVMRKMYRGLGTALSKRKSVQPSTKMVRSFNSSATGPSAGVLPLLVMPMNMSIFSDSLRRRISLVLASVQAALRVDLFCREQVALVHGLAEDRAGPGEEGHVADLERLVRYDALWFLLRVSEAGEAESRGRTADSGCCSDTES